MALSRRAALQTARQLRSQPQRRYAGHDSHGHHDSHGPAVDESLGAGFWGSVAVVPIAYALYLAANPSDKSEKPFITRMMHKFDYLDEVWKQRNDLHTLYVEKAAADRILMYNSDVVPGRRTFPARNFESLNDHSPYSVPAGWGSINLERVIAHHEQKNAEEEQRRVARYKQWLEEEARK